MCLYPKSNRLGDLARKTRPGDTAVDQSVQLLGALGGANKCFSSLK